jgi:hypothetical protein
MARAFRVLVLVLAGFVVVYFAIGSILPAQWRVESTQLIAAEPARILPLLQDFSTWERWSDVQAVPGANSKRTVEGQAGQPGHRLRWVGAQGEAAFTLVRAGPDGIAYAYTVRLPEDQEARLRGTGSITIEVVAEGTRVTWRDESKADSLPLRWFCWFGALQEAVRRAQVGSLGGLGRAVADGGGAAQPGEAKR